MDLSVVVPTLNGRDRLNACLDALRAHAPDAEVIVVNGPSADGTTGMVRSRDDVDVLVEVADRTVNVARNAGIEAATGDVIALVDYDRQIASSWLEAVSAAIQHADVVTGPVRSSEEPDADGPEQRAIAGRAVTYFAGGNVVFRREVLRALDGFDEYLYTGGARDAAHRLAAMDHTVEWVEDAAVTATPAAHAAPDGGRTRREWGWKYRALAYRLAKNYGARPTVVSRTGKHACRDALAVARDVVRGDATPSRWVANGRDVVAGVIGGCSAGVVSRARDRSSRRNPNGISARADRAVARYDERADAG